jgi:phage tail-like protein
MADPFRAFQFLVELDNEIVAQFTECTGLGAETEVDEYAEGGANGFRHKLPKASRYGNVTLRYGMTDSSALWDWYSARLQESFTGDGARRRLAVILWDGPSQEQVWRWDFDDAYPVRWTGPDLKAATSAVAIEAIELAHHGMSSGQAL